MLTTEIELILTTAQPGEVCEDVVRLSSESNSGSVVIIWDADNNVSETLDVPHGNEIQMELEDGTSYTFIEGIPFSHAYPAPGEHRVKIQAFSRVDKVDFSTRITSSDWAPNAQAKPWITKIDKFKSTSLQDLSWTFAGLSALSFDPEFVLETPAVMNVSFAFQQAFTSVQYPVLPAGLFSQITGVTAAYRTFFQAGAWNLDEGYTGGIVEIPEGFLDSFSSCAVLFEFFRQCPLGANRTPETIDTYIPSSLLWKMVNLRNITGLFNACIDFHGSYPSGYSLKPTVKADWFKNTVIATADYAFYNWNRANVEPDLFRHIKGTLKSIEGIFCNWNQAGTAINYGTIKAGATNDLAQVFPDSSYPGIINMKRAFQPAAPGVADGSWNGHPGGGSEINVQVKLDLAAFIAKFPACNATSAGGEDGRGSAFGNLTDNCENWEQVAAVDDGIWTNN